MSLQKQFSLRGERHRLKLMFDAFNVLNDNTITDWGSDPHTEGAYSMPGLDWEPEQDRVFDQKAGAIAFAGEHTHFASLNGALDSGARAAKLLTLI